MIGWCTVQCFLISNLSTICIAQAASWPGISNGPAMVSLDVLRFVSLFFLRCARELLGHEGEISATSVDFNSSVVASASMVT